MGHTQPVFTASNLGLAWVVDLAGETPLAGSRIDLMNVISINHD